MSASKIRLLAAGQNPDYEKLIDFYNGFLTPDETQQLIEAIRRGVNLKVVGGSKRKLLKNKTFKKSFNKKKKTKKMKKTKKTKK